MYPESKLTALFVTKLHFVFGFFHAAGAQRGQLCAMLIFNNKIKLVCKKCCVMTWMYVEEPA